jgi:hypothetical protein
MTGGGKKKTKVTEINNMTFEELIKYLKSCKK